MYIFPFFVFKTQGPGIQIYFWGKMTNILNGGQQKVLTILFWKNVKLLCEGFLTDWCVCAVVGWCEKTARMSTSTIYTAHAFLYYVIHFLYLLCSSDSSVMLQRKTTAISSAPPRLRRLIRFPQHKKKGIHQCTYHIQFVLHLGQRGNPIT